MSKEQAALFFREMANNKKLAEEVSKIVNGTSDQKATANKLTSLAQKHGFEFTVEEAATSRSELLEQLSDKDLINVVGDFGFFSTLINVVMSVFSAVGSFTGASLNTPKPSPNEIITVSEQKIEDSDKSVIEQEIDDFQYASSVNSESSSDDNKSVLEQKAQGSNAEQRMKEEHRLQKRIDDMIKKYDGILTQRDRKRLNNAKKSL